jgi:uncharacterized membrane-anchored protein YhcB (DUF1043 family)
MKTLALVAVALLFSGPIALAGQETLWTGTRPNDYFDLLLLKESTERWVAIVGLVVIGVLAVVIYARTSHVRSEIEKKVEDEFNEIKQRYDMDLDPKSQVLTENQRLQNLKDVFQTIRGRRHYGVSARCSGLVPKEGGDDEQGRADRSDRQSSRAEQDEGRGSHRRADGDGHQDDL